MAKRGAGLGAEAEVALTNQSGRGTCAQSSLSRGDLRYRRKSSAARSPDAHLFIIVALKSRPSPSKCEEA